MTEIKSGRGRVASFEYVEPEGKSIFSKGPWEWYENISGEKIGISDGEKDVLYVNHSESVVIPREKDAHLIAAAPDLYEALSELVDELSESLQRVTSVFGESREIEKARAALAKARGES